MRTFRGGIHPPQFKFSTRGKKIRPARLPKKAVIPLNQHTGAICKPTVKVGDRVDVGTKVGEAAGFISSPVHSSISGVVIKIDNFPHPVIGRCLSVIVESDGQDRLGPSIKRKPESPSPFFSPRRGEGKIENPSPPRGENAQQGSGTFWAQRGEGRGEGVNLQDLEFEPDQIRKAALDCGIVGMGGAAFPTHVKLTPPKGKTIDTFILNGTECEPYLSCDHRLMLEKSDEILVGARLIMKALGVNRCYLGIENNKPDAVKVMRQAAKRFFPHPSPLPRGERENARAPTKLKIVSLKTKYPQGAEKQLIKAILNREVPSGGLPFDVGVVVQNVGTALALYEAVLLNKPLYERVITVAGKCVREPANLMVRIGTPIAELVEDCGGLVEEPARIVIGGPLMGIAQYTEQVPVIKGTSGVLFLSRDEVDIEEASACIRCGRCVEICPVGILPASIGLAAEKERFELAMEYGCLDCIECGACSFVCPTKRDLVHLIKYAKANLRKAEAAQNA